MVATTTKNAPRQSFRTAHGLACLPAVLRERLRDRADPKTGAAFRACWSWRAAPAQRAPEGAWSTWILLGGRGGGKTRAGAEWVRAEVESGRRRRLALVGPTHHDVRTVMIEGVSGLLGLGGMPVRFEPSLRRLVWANGAVASIFSAQQPERLRGPQFDGAWADELCAWPDPGAVLANLRLCLRVGACPQMVVTTTPKADRGLEPLIAEPDAVVTVAPTRGNLRNLSPGFLDGMRRRLGGGDDARRELDGVLLGEAPGALWTRAALAALVEPPPPSLDAAVVAVDPPAGLTGDACGIVAAGAIGFGRARRAIVLDDRSAHGLAPLQWAQRAVSLAHEVGADRIVAESNQGGEMVRAVLREADPGMPVKLVRARHGKRLRAEPVAALYARGRVAHARRFAALEDEMCAFGTRAAQGSPDRLDALVWALDDLMFDGADPAMRAL